MTDVLMCGDNPIGQLSDYDAGTLMEASSIAPTETLISTHAYAKDDLLTYNGQLYIATSAIAVGDTITSKIERTTTTSYVNPTRMNHIEDGIADISDAVNSVSIVSETSVTTSINDTAYLYKLSNGVKVISYNSSNIQGIEYNNLFSIPTGYEPTVNKNHFFTGVTDQANMRMCKLSNGSVSVYAQGNNDRGFYVLMSYS